MARALPKEFSDFCHSCGYELEDTEAEWDAGTYEKKAKHKPRIRCGCGELVTTTTINSLTSSGQRLGCPHCAEHPWLGRSWSTPARYTEFKDLISFCIFTLGVPPVCVGWPTLGCRLARPRARRALLRPRGLVTLLRRLVAPLLGPSPPLLSGALRPCRAPRHAVLVEWVGGEHGGRVGVAAQRG